jgi:hypothetical protein
MQMRVSGCNNHYEFILSAEAKAKTVTNNLPILSVLAFRANLKTVTMRRICHDVKFVKAFSPGLQAGFVLVVLLC